MIRSELYAKWLLDSNIKPMTRNQESFAKFIFNNIEQLTPLGNFSEIFDSVYDFAKNNRTEIGELRKSKVGLTIKTNMKK